MDIGLLLLLIFFIYYFGSKFLEKKKSKPIEDSDCSHIWETWKVHTKEVKVYNNYSKFPVESYMLLQRVCTMCELIETKRVET